MEVFDLEKYFFADGYNKALEDVVALIEASDNLDMEELVYILELSKIDFNEVEL